MAAETPPDDQLARDLEWIKLSLDDLIVDAAEWDQLSLGVTSAWYYEWAECMDRLALLHLAYEAGRLSEDQQRRYRRLLRDLETNLPLIEHLGLQRPPVPLEV